MPSDDAAIEVMARAVDRAALLASGWSKADADAAMAITNAPSAYGKQSATAAFAAYRRHQQEAGIVEVQAARIAALEAALKNVNVALTDAILRTRSIEDAELWTTIRDAARAALEGKPLGSLGRPTDWDIENGIS